MDDALEIALEPSDSADACFCLDRYFAEIALRFGGDFDPHAGALPVPPGEASWFLVARLGGYPVGCGMLKTIAPGTGEIKRVWTDGGVRGRGIASRLMDRIEATAREAGLARVVLDTNRSLTEAKSLYERRGYVAIPPYNDNPYADHWFELRLIETN